MTPPSRLLAALALAFGACTLPQPFRCERELAEEGRLAYEESCAACHGLTATGHGPVAPALKVPPGDLTRLAARHGGVFPRAYVLEVMVGRRPIVAHGTREMPVWRERFDSSGLGGIASTYARRRRELIADHLESVQRLD